MIRNRLFRAVVAFICIWSIQFQAVAQTPSYSGLDHINRIINGTPGVGGITMQGTANGLNLGTTGNVSVASSSGMRIPVPTTATAGISRATLALNAARLARATTIIGAGIGAYEVYNWIKDRGIKTCPPPDFFCGPPTEGPSPTGINWRYDFDTLNGGGGTSASAACSGAAGAASSYYASQGGGATVAQMPTADNWWECRIQIKVGAYQPAPQAAVQKSACTAGGYFDFRSPTPCGGTLQPAGPGKPYANEQELADAITITQWDFGHAENLADAINKGRQRLPGVVSQGQLVPTGSPVTVTAPPVTTPETVTKVETVAKPDGSTDTVTTKEKTTVTPKIEPPANGQPASLENPPKVSYPTSTVTTTTTTNNVTNNTTTNTTTTTTAPQPAEEEPSALCKMFPDIVACAKLGTAPDAEKLVPVDATPAMTTITFASAAACPTPITYSLGKYGTKQLEFTPLCDWLALIRPLFLAIGSAAVAFIFMKGVQTA